MEVRVRRTKNTSRWSSRVAPRWGRLISRRQRGTCSRPGRRQQALRRLAPLVHPVRPHQGKGEPRSLDCPQRLSTLPSSTRRPTRRRRQQAYAADLDDQRTPIQVQPAAQWRAYRAHVNPGSRRRPSWIYPDPADYMSLPGIAARQRSRTQGANVGQPSRTRPSSGFPQLQVDLVSGQGFHITIMLKLTQSYLRVHAALVPGSWRSARVRRSGITLMLCCPALTADVAWFVPDQCRGGGACPNHFAAPSEIEPKTS